MAERPSLRVIHGAVGEPVFWHTTAQQQWEAASPTSVAAERPDKGERGMDEKQQLHGGHVRAARRAVKRGAIVASAAAGWVDYLDGLGPAGRGAALATLSTLPAMPKAALEPVAAAPMALVAPRAVSGLAAGNRSDLQHWPTGNSEEEFRLARLDRPLFYSGPSVPSNSD